MSTTPDDQNDLPARPGTPRGEYPPSPAGGGSAGSAGGYPPPPAGAGSPSADYPPPPPAPGGGGYPPPPPGAPSGYPPPGGYPPPPQGPGYGHGTPTPGGYPPSYGSGAPLSPSDQRLWAVLGHLGVLVVWFFAPLVIWLVFRGRGAFLEDHAKESLNFQITTAIAVVALSIVSVVTFGIGVLLYVPLGIAWFVLLIIAAVKASQGEPYRYPLTLRLVS